MELFGHVYDARQPVEFPLHFLDTLYNPIKNDQERIYSRVLLYIRRFTVGHHSR
jgi:hypothetical protein